MLDTVVEMLGPNAELVSELLGDLGSKHRAFGVNPKFFDVLGFCLLDVVEKMTGPTFDEATKEAWKAVYGAIAKDMVLGYDTTR